MRVLLDTNVLVRVVEETHASHPVAVSAIKILESQNAELLIVPQTVYEFWSVVTRSVAANGLGKSTATTEGLIYRFCSVFRLLRDERSIYETWLKFVADFAITRAKIYDARLAAAMLRHDITHLLTFNPADFRRFSHITVLEPAALSTQTPKA